MKTITGTEARVKRFILLDHVAESHVPVQIRGKRPDAIMISQDVWRTIQETLYLLITAPIQEDWTCFLPKKG